MKRPGASADKRAFAKIDPAALVRVPLDGFEAVYQRRSGMTHMLAEPAPQLLDILTKDAASLDEIVTSLQRDFDLDDDGQDAAGILAIITERLLELSDLGLVEPLAAR